MSWLGIFLRHWEINVSSALKMWCINQLIVQLILVRSICIVGWYAVQLFHNWGCNIFIYKFLILFSMVYICCSMEKSKCDEDLQSNFLMWALNCLLYVLFEVLCSQPFNIPLLYQIIDVFLLLYEIRTVRHFIDELE